MTSSFHISTAAQANTTEVNKRGKKVSKEKPEELVQLKGMESNVKKGNWIPLNGTEYSWVALTTAKW